MRYLQKLFFIFLWAIFFGPAVVAAEIAELRCEYQRNPVSIHTRSPRLSWIIESAVRDFRQSAYQVLVASSLKKLEEERGDLWDTGKVESSQSILVPYCGQALSTKMRCYWKVRVWDGSGKVSPYSEPGRWSMGLLKRSDWGGGWIGAVAALPARLDQVVTTTRISYHAIDAENADEEKWLQLDLGSTREIEKVVLYGLDYLDPYSRKHVEGFGFPVRFRIDASDDANFVDFSNIAEHTKEDYPNPGASSVEFEAGEVEGRFVRVSATKLWRHESGRRPYCFGLSEIEVYSGGRNAAGDATVTVKNQDPNWTWDDCSYIDGVKRTEPNHPEYAAILMRKEIELEEEPAEAVAYICGLGYYELYINGEKAGDHVLDPAFTDYTHRVFYVTYDIGELLKKGRNVISVIVGGGWYNLATPDLDGLNNARWTSAPKLLFNADVEFEDGEVKSIVSDSSWKWSTGEIVFNCLRSGEVHDARLRKLCWKKGGYDDSSWQHVKEVSGARGRLVSQQLPPIRICESINPVRISEPNPGVYVFDFGVNISGWVRLKTRGERGRKITLQFNEKLNDDGTVNMRHCSRHTYGIFQTEEFILSGEGTEIFEPKFSYHGFQYVEVRGLSQKPELETLTGRWVHTDLKETGRFRCSNSRFNRIHEVSLRSNLDNSHSIPTDCPNREKMGWTQDGMTTMEFNIYNYEVATFYKKWMYDIRVAQEENGHVPPIAPDFDLIRTNSDGAPPDWSDPWWGGAIAYLPWMWYQYYGDIELLGEFYEPMRRYVDYLGTTTDDDILRWWLGDWVEVGSSRSVRTPIALSSTCAYYYCTEIVTEAAGLLGKEVDVCKYGKLCERIKERFNERFFDPNTGFYSPDSQTAQALPLLLGMVRADKEDLALYRLVQNIHRRENHISTGLVGALPLMKALNEFGHAELAYEIANQPDFPGWWNLIKNGLSTFPENWYGSGTLCHKWLGCIDTWYFQTVGGIRPDVVAPGFKNTIIKPEIVGDLTWGEADFKSPYGYISTKWRLDEDRFELEVIIPANTTATVFIPASGRSSVSESGRSCPKAPGIHSAKLKDGLAILQVGSGRYHFISKMP